MTRSRARLIRRVIRGEEVEEVQLGEVEVDLPSDYIHGGGGDIGVTYLTQSPSLTERPSQWTEASTSDFIDVYQDHTNPIIHIPVDEKTVLEIKWGDENFTAIFPKKEEGAEVKHDMPIGRIEWIIEERVDDE